MIRWQTCGLLFALCVAPTALAQQRGADDASPQTRRIVAQMIEAHGGMARWKASPSVSYTNVFFNPFAEPGQIDQWWIARETIEQNDLHRVYQEWPVEGARLVYDGDKTWTTGWQQSNPPRFMVHFFYYFLNLPWLTQEANVRLGPPMPRTLPGSDKTYTTIHMAFDEPLPVGKGMQDYFVLYIDPGSHLLVAYEYGVSYGALLDAAGLPEGEIYGPILRRHDRFATVDGLTVPSIMHTTDLEGTTTYGYHALFDYSFSKSFDASQLKMPPHAVVDSSSHLRRK